MPVDRIAGHDLEPAVEIDVGDDRDRAAPLARVAGRLESLAAAADPEQVAEAVEDVGADDDLDVAVAVEVGERRVVAIRPAGGAGVGVEGLAHPLERAGVLVGADVVDGGRAEGRR